RDAAFALDAFDQDRRRRGRKRRADSVEVVVGHLAEARNHRLEALLDLLLSGGGNASEGAAMKRVESGDDLEPAVVVTELAGEFEETFVGLGAAVAEKT